MIENEVVRMRIAVLPHDAARICEEASSIPSLRVAVQFWGASRGAADLAGQKNLQVSVVEHLTHLKSAPSTSYKRCV